MQYKQTRSLYSVVSVLLPQTSNPLLQSLHDTIVVMTRAMAIRTIVKLDAALRLVRLALACLLGVREVPRITGFAFAFDVVWVVVL